MPWQIDTAQPLSAEADAAIAARIDDFDRTYSRFRDDSLVSTIAHTPGTYRFPPDAPLLFDLYRRLYTATRGAMSPLVGRALEELGYDSTYSLQPSATRTRVPEWHEALSWNGNELTTRTPAMLDVGAAGKGYLVDLVAEVLRAHGVDASTVDASGDILHRGADGLHHILDARTGLPTDRIVATWAIAPTALEADGLATALFFAEPATLAAEFDFQWVRMFSTGRVEYSPEINGELFL